MSFPRRRETNKMRILFLQEQPCIRALKYAQGLRSLGNSFKLFFGYRGSTLDDYYGHGGDLFEEWFKIGGDFERDIESIAKQVEPDLIHCHNAPDSLTVSSLRLFKDVIPIIHDIHDLLSLRKTPYDDGLERERMSLDLIRSEEKTAMEGSDGLIAVSEAILEIAARNYSLDQKESLVFPNYVVTDMIPSTLEEKLSCSDGMIHLVYEGHLDSRRSGGHYDLFQIFKDIAEQDIHVHIYPSTENELYEDLGENYNLIHYHRHLPPQKLMMEITQYDFGWSGFNVQKNRTHADTVLANKTFEYIAAGLPVVTFPHRSQKRFIERYGVGIVVDSLDDLAAKLTPTETRDVKGQVLRNRYSFTVENQINKISKFYQKILDSFPS